MQSKLDIMRLLVKLDSPIVLRNEIKNDIEVHFKDVIGENYVIHLKENEVKPLPFDKVKDQLKIAVVRKGRKIEGNWFYPLEPRANNESVNYQAGGAFAFNMLFEDIRSQKSSKDGQNRDMLQQKKITMVPPVIVKNKILTDINFYIVKKNFDTVYGEKHKIASGHDDFEIYEILENVLQLRIGINSLKTDIIEIDVSNQSMVTTKSLWIKNRGRKAINIHLIGRFERGSYVIDVFMKAMLIDELFMDLKYSQNIGTNEEVIYPINKLSKDQLSFVGKIDQEVSSIS